MEDFTGDYYKCRNCNYVWDFVSDKCPDCGSDSFDETSIEAEITKTKTELHRLQRMKQIHD